MRDIRTLVIAVALAALAGWYGCRPRPSPEQLVNQAEILRQQYDKASSQRAVADYQRAMAAWDRQGDRQLAARAALAAGDTSWQLGLAQEALGHYRAALARVTGSPDRLLESEIRSSLGTAAAYASDPDAAEQCGEALVLARELHGDREAARAMSCLGEVAYFAQRLDEAITYYREAERLSAQLGDQRGLAQAAGLQGDVHSDLSRFDEALTCYERARALWLRIGDRRGQAILLVSDARLRERRGTYQEALDGFTDALSRLEPMGNAMWEGAALTGLASVHDGMGDAGAALAYWERAVKAFDAAGLKAISTPVLQTLGEVYLASGQDTEALARFELSLKQAEALSNDRYRAFALRDIATVHLFRRQPADALKALEASLGIQRRFTDPRLAGGTRGDIGEAWALLGDHARASSCFTEALVSSRQAEDRVEEARLLFGLARATQRRGDLAGARRHVEQALAVVESLRTAVENRDLRASYFASVHRYHELHLDVLMQLHRTRPSQGLSAEAFRASERARARSLLESLASASVDLRAGADPDLLRRDQMIRAAFDDWARRRRRAADTPASRADLATLASEYRTLEDRYNQVQAEIRRRSPRYAALATPRSVGLEEVQSQLLDDETLLLEYTLGEDRSYLWAITTRDRVAHELPPRAVIERAATHVHDLLTARLAAGSEPRDRARRIQRADAEYWQEARRLSEMLLAPVASPMTRRRLVIVADGALLYLPFAALPEPRGGADPVPLIVAHEIVSLPSASVLAVIRQESAGRAPRRKVVAVLADPVFESDDPRLRRLPTAEGRRGPTSNGETPSAPSGTLRDAEFPPAGTVKLPRLASTRQEADAIVSAAPLGTSLRKVDFDASRAAAMGADLADYRIVHFATHGVLDNENPGLSGVALSMFDDRGRPQDGFLRLHDIYALRLPVDLVVLSACDTALGKPLRGEGLVGIVRGFMHAGATRVVASLWKVDDDATGELMRRFYREMLVHRRSPAAALRLAQLSMWQQDGGRAPYYWAAFVLQGDWR